MQTTTTTRNELTIGRKVLYTSGKAFSTLATITEVNVNRELGVRYYRICLANGTERNVRASEITLSD